MQAPGSRSIDGDVVRLEPLEERHRPALIAAAAVDPAAFSIAGPIPTADEWIDAALAQRAAGSRLPYVVILADDGTTVGSSSYLDIAPAEGRIEIGHTWYGGPWQGTVVNPACKLALLTEAFDVLGALRVTLKCDARNEQSRRGILGIGATFEGVMRRHSPRADGPGQRDVALFSVIDDDWPAVRALLERRVRDHRHR